MVLLIGLAGCADRNDHFNGSPVTRIAVAGSEFDVRVRGELAEAVRRNPQYAPRFGPIRARAGFAMAEVSGCRIEQVLGDAAVALGLLDCDGRPRSWPLATGAYDCVQLDSWVSHGQGLEYFDYDCTPI